MRRLTAINRVIREVAALEGAVLVDMDKISEQESEHGLVGFNLIEDYVHPNQTGHQLIAWHTWRAIETAQWRGTLAPASCEMFANRKVTLPAQEAAWLYNQGALLAHQGRLAQASEKFRQTLEILPDYESALYNLGAMLLNTAQFEEALPVLQRLMQINPDHADGHSALATVLQNLGKYDEAVVYFRKALAAKPDFVAARHNLANALASLGRYDEAIEELQLALNSDPQNAQLHAKMGSVCLQKGLQGKAIEHLETAVRLESEPITAHYLMGRALLVDGDNDGAKSKFRQVLQMNPNHAQARSLLDELKHSNEN